jgi:predicted metal-dependent peptidase
MSDKIKGLSKGNHPQIIETVERMLIDVKHKLPFYGHFNLEVNFKETKSIPTCGVNMTNKGMYFYFNDKFLTDLGTVDGVLKGSNDAERELSARERQKQTNFIVLHEDFHLLFNHPQRTLAGRFNPYLSNIAQDMIINSVIWDDIHHDFVGIPKYPDNEVNRDKGIANQSMALFIPKEYFDDKGEPIFEELYNWLKQKKEDHDKRRCDDSSITGGYGVNGITPNGTEVVSYDLEHIFDNMEDNEGQWMDSHIEDEIPAELRDSMIRDSVDRLKSRGLSSGSVEQVLMKLRKKRKDYLREIKRSISNEIMGNKKMKSITRPNRRGIVGVKGNRKYKPMINVLLDTSGSMGGMFEKVLEYVFQNDVEINICEVDTQVHSMETVSSMKQLQALNIMGLGGTMLQPGIDLITNSKDYNRFNTVLLTDGWCDTLDMSKMKGRVLGVTCGDPIPISNNPQKGYREIVVERTT